MPTSSALERALLLGAVTGLRSFLGIALLTHKLARQPSRALQSTSLAPLANENLAKALSVLSAGELVADKLPIVPSRTDPGPLLGRALLGALAGATVYAEERESLATGAAVGAAAAMAATFGAYHLRQWLDKSVGLPDTAVALAEDTLAVSLGTKAVTQCAARAR